MLLCEAGDLLGVGPDKSAGEVRVVSLCSTEIHDCNIPNFDGIQYSSDDFQREKKATIQEFAAWPASSVKPKVGESRRSTRSGIALAAAGFFGGTRDQDTASEVPRWK